MDKLTGYFTLLLVKNIHLNNKSIIKKLPTIISKENSYFDIVTYIFNRRKAALSKI